MEQIKAGIREDIRELKFNLRTGDPDTYFMIAMVILCVVALATAF